MTDSARELLIIGGMFAGLVAGVIAHELSHTIPDRYYGIPFSYTLVSHDGYLTRLGISVPLVNATPMVVAECNPYRIPGRVIRIGSLSPLAISGPLALALLLAPVETLPPWVLLTAAVLCFANFPSSIDLMNVVRSTKRSRLAGRADWHRELRYHRYAEGIEEPALRLCD